MLHWSNIFAMSFEEELYRVNEENHKILEEQYLPYTSDYNPTVLWALNGLVPDDPNNIFSNKTCAIIDGLKEHMDSSEIVSLVPTDTAIIGKDEEDGKKGIKLSPNAVIAISRERYEVLSQEEKEKLDSLGIKEIRIFEGDLQQAVTQILEESGRFTAEKLSSKNEKGGYIPSETSDELKKTINNVAQENKIAQELYFNIMERKSDELDKLESTRHLKENYNMVMQFYEKAFFNYVFSKLDINPETQDNVLSDTDARPYMDALCDEIENIGIDKYRDTVSEYNTRLEQLQQSGDLPTPQQIIDSINEGKPLDLLALIEKNEEEILVSTESIGKLAGLGTYWMMKYFKDNGKPPKVMDKDYEEEIMEGLGHGEFFLKHQDKMCKKITEVINKA